MTDPIERLRDADPVPEPVSHPHDAPVRATLEEIMMTTNAPTPPRAAWYRNPAILGVAAAVLLVVAVIGVAFAGDDGNSDAGDESALPTAPDGATGDEPTTSDDLFPGDEPTDGVTPGDSTQATSCVELYDLDTLTNREYAFDGTVVGVDGTDMTFEVNEWFTGGEGDTITLDHQGMVGMLFSPDGPALEPGTRVLLAGDGGFVWSCGFTQAYDPDVADQWRRALAG